MEFLPIIILIAGIAIGIPVAIAIASAGLAFFLSSGAMPVEIFVQRMVAVTHSFPLLAVPLFVMTGVMMNYGGITKRMMNFAESMTGHMIGGLAQVNVVLSTLLGGVAGSANADAAMQSKIIVPEMTKRNYDRGFSTAVTAASSIISVIIPPGIGLILYGFMGDVSIGKLFLAGIVPGIILCVLMMIMVGFISKRNNYLPVLENKASWQQRWQALRGAGWALLIPFGIVGGIRFGVVTPTEAGALAVVCSLLVGMIYRELKFEHIVPIVRQTTEATAIVLFVICAANAFGFYMTWERIPQMVTSFMLTLTDNWVILLLFINILLVLVGMFVEGSAALILLTPILVPVISKIGIDPVQFGIVMVLNLTIAGVTPPLGTIMFTACSITGASIKEFVVASLPFYAVLFAMLMLITFVPALTTWLPNL